MLKKRVTHVTFNNGPTNMGYNDFYITSKKLGYDVNCIYFSNSVNSIYKDGLSAKGSLFELFKMIVREIKHADVIHFHSHHFAFFLSWLNLFSKCDFVYTVHTSYENLKFRNYIFFFFGILFCSKTYFVSESAFRSFPKYIKNIFKRKIHIIRNGVQIPTKPDGLKTNKSISILGRLNKLKRSTSVARSLSVSDFCGDIDIIGVGDECDEVKSILGSNKALIAHFHGMIPREQVLKLLFKSNLYLSFSAIEGMPIAALEAAVCGNFLILSDIQPHREIATVIPHVLLVKDEKEMTEAINNYLLNEIYKDRTVFDENRNSTIEHFSLNAMIQKYYESYSAPVRTEAS